MSRTTPLISAEVRELAGRIALLLEAEGYTVASADVRAELPALLGKLGIPLVGHTCTSTGKPLPYGRLAPQGECDRCDERRQEKAAGIPARPAPAHFARREQSTNGYPSTSAIDDHFRPGGKHATGGCGPVCTFGDW